MGCGKTKHKQELDFEIEEVKNESIDRLLQSLAGPLKILKEYHDTLDYSLGNLYYFTGANHYLKQPTLESALKVFIYTAASAAHQSEHNLKQVIKFHQDPPFFVSDEHKMEGFAKQGIQECMEIIRYIKKLALILSEGPTKFYPIFESLVQGFQESNSKELIQI